MPVKETTTRRTASSKDGGTPVVTEETKTNRSRSGKSGPGDIAKSAKDTAKQAQNLAGEASEFVGSFADAAVNFLGGWTTLDGYIKRYNPLFFEFVEKSFLKNISAANKPSKFVLLCLALGLLQSNIPVFQWPLDLVARMLGFLFLYNAGIDELTKGFGESDTRANKVKSLLVTYLVVSTFQLVPTFLFDTVHNFGALWCLFLPVAMLIIPAGDGKGQTVAGQICDTLFSQISGVIDSLVPAQFRVDRGQHFSMAGGAIVAVLLWVGMLGGFGSYLVIWAFLGISTVSTLGKGYVKSSSSSFPKQMTIWHNLLAIWLWRYLISAIEGICIPGVLSVRDLMINFLPTYFLWTTGFLLGMLVTKKTAGSDTKANSWYAKWLRGGAIMPKKSSGSGERGSGRSDGERRTR